MAMPIERSNSFHLMLSDDELSLLRLLAERDGLNASDYLRTLLRREAGGSPMQSAAVRLAGLVGQGAIDRAWRGQKAFAKKPAAKATKKKRTG